MNKPDDRIVSNRVRTDLDELKRTFNILGIAYDMYSMSGSSEKSSNTLVICHNDSCFDCHFHFKEDGSFSKFEIG